MTPQSATIKKARNWKIFFFFTLFFFRKKLLFFYSSGEEEQIMAALLKIHPGHKPLTQSFSISVKGIIGGWTAFAGVYVFSFIDLYTRGG